MKSYIENIRKSLKKLGHAPTSDIIRNAINLICPDGKNILENKSAIVDEAIKLIKLSYELTLAASANDNNFLNSVPNDTPNDTNQMNKKLEDLIEIIPENEALPTPDSDEINSSEIVVNAGEKHELIASQASALGIELSEVEVVELATGLKDSFLDHECFIEGVVEAIVTYHDHRTSGLEQKIKDAREHIEFRRKQLNQTLVGEFGEMNNFFRSQSAKQRELSKIIAAAFKT